MSRTEFFKRMEKEVKSAYEWNETLDGISTGSLAIDRILGTVGGLAVCGCFFASARKRLRSVCARQLSQS